MRTESCTLAGVASHVVNQPVLAVDADMGLHAKVPLVAHAGLVHVGSWALSLFLVELGAWMMLASMMVPREADRPFSCR